MEIAIPRKFRNKYTINGDEVIIELKRRDGTIKYTKIDTEDLQKLIDFKYTWYANYRERNNDWYACATIYTEENGKLKHTTIRMHVFLMNTRGKEKVHVDHVDHNGLNNKKSNLRISTVDQNLHNRKARNITNKSGYRNVSIARDGRWEVTLRIKGKQPTLGSFVNVHEAGKYANKMREKYYGEYKGNE